MRFMKLVIKNSDLLGCDTALLDHQPLQVTAKCSFETMGTNDPAMIHHIPQDWTPQV